MHKLPKTIKRAKGKTLKAGVFIDDANLYYAQKAAGWKIDFKKLKKFLNGKYKVEIFYYYVAIPDRSDINYRSTEKYLEKIQKYAVIKEKPLKYIKIQNKVITKGNVDVEIVLDVVRNIEKLDVAIIVSGDSDFLELKNWVVYEQKKGIIFTSFEKNMSWELRQCWHIYLDKIRSEIELIK